MEEETWIQKLHIDQFLIEILQPFFQIREGLAPNRSSPCSLDRLAWRRRRPRGAGAFDTRPPIRSLAINDPEIVALIVFDQLRPVVPKRRFHVLFEHFFGFEKMAVSIDDHWELLVKIVSSGLFRISSKEVLE